MGFISSVGETGCCVLWNTKTAKVNIGYDFEELVGGSVRIGQYDFTKQEQPKEIEWCTCSDWMIGLGGENLVYKINELVDAVNELRKDVNK